MIGSRRFSVSFIISILFLSLVPPGATGSDGSSDSPSTQISLSGNYIITANGALITNSDIEISFIVTVPSGNFIQGTYSYSGIAQGNGSFNETGTTIEIQSNSSGYATLTYFANSTNGNESPNQIEILFDQSPPSPSLSPLVNSTLEVSGSSYTLTASSSGSIIVSCSDTYSSTESMRVVRNIDQSEIIRFNNSSTEELSIEDIVDVSQSTTTNFTFYCTDFFGNEDGISFTLQLDTDPPNLGLHFYQPIEALDCLPNTWALSLTAEDISQPVRMKYSIDNQSSWNTLTNPFSPPTTFSGTLHLSGSDSVGNTNFTSVMIPGFDQNEPQISILSVDRNHTISFWDDCDENPSTSYRWESTNGTNSAWYALIENGTTVTVPDPFYETGYRLNVVSTDHSSRTVTVSNDYSPGTGSSVSINLVSTSLLG